MLTAVKLAGAAYLVWLGIRMWRAPRESRHLSIGGRRDALTGLSVALTNPKAILFHASLLPLVVDLNRVDLLAISKVLIIVFVGNFLVMSAYALAAAAGAERARTVSGSTWLARLGGAMMIGTGTAVAIR